MYLPDNINRIIAEFLPAKTIKTNIIIYQYSGCEKNIHSYNEKCYLCKSVYNPTKIFLYLKKDGNKKLFQEYINKISEIILDPNHILTQDYSRWSGNNIIMSDIFGQGTDSVGNIAIDDTFHQTGTNKELQLYQEKYVIKGVHFALFNNFVKELKIDGFYSSKPYYNQTNRSTSWYYEIKGIKSRKNKLRVINKIYEKYTRS
jgi:hypothetical protein